MFLPLGLGIGLRKFPFAIIILTLFNVFYSFEKFKDVEAFNKELKVMVATDDFAKKSIAFLQKTCDPLDVENMYCDYFKSKDLKNLKLNELDKSMLFHFYVKTLRAGDVPEDSAQTDEFRELNSLVPDLDEKTSAYVQSLGLLNPKKFNFINLIQATFTHGGYAHLFGNLLFIIMFGIYVEQRIGSLLTFSLFMVGSLAGLYSEIMINGHIMALMGASAGATTLVGAFLVLFWHARMKFVFTYLFVYWRTMFFPVSITVPILYIANDFIMIATGNEGGVAYFAHAVGTLIGFSFGLIYKKRKPLPRHFLFDEEVDLLNKADVETDLDKKIDYYEEIGKWNNQNHFVFKFLLSEVESGEVPLTYKVQMLVLKWFESYYEYYNRAQAISKKYQLVKRTYKMTNLSKVLRRKSWQSLQRVGDHAFDLEEYEISLFLYELTISKAPKKKKMGLRKTIQNIKEFLNQEKVSE